MMLRELFLQSRFRGASLAGLALFSLLIVACDSAGGDGVLGGNNDFGNIRRASAGTVTVPPQTQVWVTAEAPLGRSSLSAGGNVV
ncbi:MAG: hypothetical protein HQK87_00240, partial [Nitrospinae bacterium]|nr:hypothetical protein [Nitrospinota bacterium]